MRARFDFPFDIFDECFAYAKNAIKWSNDLSSHTNPLHINICNVWREGGTEDSHKWNNSKFHNSIDSNIEYRKNRKDQEAKESKENWIIPDIIFNGPEIWKI